jgi:hypothetical protein
MKKRSTIIAALSAGLLSLAALAGVAVAAGPSVPLTTSTGGQAVCPAAGALPITSPDGTVCSNDGTRYVFEHGTAAPVTVQVTLQQPSRGYVSANFSSPDKGKVEFQVGRPGSPASAGFDYHGAVTVHWYVAA